MFSFVVDLIFIVLLYSMLQLLNKGVDLNSSCWQNYLSLIQVKRYAPFFFVAIFLRKYDAVNTLFNNKYIMLASLLIAVITELLKCFNFNIHAIGYWLPWIYIVLSISIIMKRFFVKFGGNLFFISTVFLFFFLNPIKSCRYVCFLVTLKTPHH